MSSEEDTELGDLVAQTLEINGCLPKLRAELRASIFLALDENVEVQKSEPLLNKTVQTYLQTQEGQNMFSLVREFLEYFGLDFTISVYEPESYLGRGYHYAGREKVVEKLNIPELKNNSLPLLLQLIRIAQLKSKQHAHIIDINLSSSTHNCDNEDGIDSEICNDSKDDQILLERCDENESSDSNFNENIMNGNNMDCVDDSIANCKPNILNTTFNLSAPSVNLVDKITLVEQADTNPHSDDSLKADDTFDSASLPLEDKSHSISSEAEFSPPFVGDKSHSKLDTTFDKPKLSNQKTDKLKTKSSLSSLADLPPIQLNKSRSDTVLLPSLYSKDFKEKTVHQNVKEIDKFFDMEALDDYEEDFLSDSEINNKSLHSIRNFSDEIPTSHSDTNLISNSSCKNIKSKDLNQNSCSLNDKTGTTIAHSSVYDINNADRSKNNSESSSVTSEDLNRNIDNILNSPTSN